MKYAIKEFMCPKKEPINLITKCSQCPFVKAYNNFCDKDDLPYCGRSPIGEHVICEIIKELKNVRITRDFINYIINNDNEGYKKRVVLWHLAKGYKYIGEAENKVTQEEMDV